MNLIQIDIKRDTMRRWILPVALVMAAGCSNSEVRTVDVSGKVTLDGHPLDGATIQFIGTQFSGYGRTNADGQFELTTGAMPGENRVVISKIDPSQVIAAEPEVDESTDSGMDAGQMEAMIGIPDDSLRDRKRKGEMLPVEYSDPDHTTLRFPVPESGTDTADFEL